MVSCSDGGDLGARSHPMHVLLREQLWQEAASRTCSPWRHTACVCMAARLQGSAKASQAAQQRWYHSDAAADARAAVRASLDRCYSEFAYPVPCLLHLQAVG